MRYLRHPRLSAAKKFDRLRPYEEMRRVTEPSGLVGRD